jgi:hypothetical protein
MQDIFGLAERMSDSYDGVSSMELIIKKVSKPVVFMKYSNIAFTVFCYILILA